MKKKFLYIILVVSAFLLASTVCFAAEDEVKSTDLGNEITSSIKETEKTNVNVISRNADSGENMKDAVKDMGNTIKDGAEDVGNTVKNGMEDAGNEIKDSGDKMKNETDNMGENSRNSVSGETSNYASRETATSNTGMNVRTWVWIIIAVAAVIIIAAVWYYAANRND